MDKNIEATTKLRGISIYTYIYMYIYICIYVYMYICIYVYVYIYIYTRAIQGKWKRKWQLLFHNRVDIGDTEG